MKYRTNKMMADQGASEIQIIQHQCPFCEFSSATLKQWLSHLRMVHQNDPGFHVCCGIDGCGNTYKKFSSLNSHVYARHKIKIQQSHTPIPTVKINDAGNEENAMGMSTDLNMREAAQPDVLENSQSDLFDTAGFDSNDMLLQNKKLSASFLLKLKEGHCLSQVAIGEVISGCEQIVECTLFQAKSSVQSTLSHMGVTDSALVLEAFEQPSPFTGLRSKHLQQQFYVQQLGMVEPIKQKLGEEAYVVRGSGSKRRRVLTNDTFYYVPLDESLKQLLSHPDVALEISMSHKSTDGLLRDFCDGAACRDHMELCNEGTLQLIAYFDEIEICNPLGSSAKKHKIGVFLYTVGNLRPKLRSSLRSIILFAVAKSTDIKQYGIDSILKPFIRDINRISKDGIDIGSCIVKANLLAFLGDNMGSNLIGGFKESMGNALRFCRTCLATRHTSQWKFRHISFDARDNVSHADHCNLLKGPLKDHHSMVYGINRKAALQDVNHFSVVTGLPHDIMHDLLEGACLFEIKACLNHCVNEKYFTVDELNERIMSFDFDTSENANKPACIDEKVLKSKDGKLHQSASQMWLLSRMLPLLIGDKVPSQDENWYCYTILLKILDICTQHECSENTVAYLDVLIEEHHTLYREIYTHESIKPKHHFMVHYPQQILTFGPLINCWTMRHEAKLKLCKMVGRFGNFKNICLSIAEKHQRWLCYHLQFPRGSFLTESVEVGGRSQCLNVVEERQDIKEELNLLGVGDDAVVCHPAWVLYFNSTFKRSNVIIVKYDEYPVFAKIIDIISLPDSRIIFCAFLYKTLHFNNHYHAFVVELTTQIVCIGLSDIVYPFSLSSHKNFDPHDDSFYIVLKYGIDAAVFHS